MEYFLQQLINGLTLGAVYGLIAVGYTMVYGIIGMINFAHGEIYMIGAFITAISFTVLSLWACTRVSRCNRADHHHAADQPLRLECRARGLSPA